jgi:hypothetical protein
VPYETKTLVFYVTDNEGEGNCFYEAICDSVAFVKEYPQYKNNHEALRKKIAEHQRKNQGLARKFFDAFLGLDETTEWAGNLLHETVKKKPYRSGDEFFRQLCSSNDFLKEYEFPKKPIKKIYGKLC